MGPRKRVRLQKDHEELVRLTTGRTTLVSFDHKGVPPTYDKFTMNLKGLRLEGDRAIPQDIHQFELRLGAHYPSEPPDVTWLTPIFHPNIAARPLATASSGRRPGRSRTSSLSSATWSAWTSST